MKMAITICVLFLTALMAAVSNADVSAFAGGGSFGLNPAQAFGSNGPFRIQMPNIPPLPWPSNFPFLQHPSLPPLNTIKPSTFQSIAAQGGQPGGHFNGLAIGSQPSDKKDGQLGTTGGSTEVFNDNGKITVQQTDVSAFAGGGSFGLNPAQAFGSNGPFRMQMPSIPLLPWPSNPPIYIAKPSTFQSIAAQGGQPGGHFNGLAIFSQSSNKKDGQLGTTGGSTVVFNDNGKITVQQTGDAPPPVSITEYKEAPFADFQQPEFEDFSDHIKKPDFDFPNFKPFDIDEIKSYVPESNEKFEGSAYSYNSYSSDVNGVKKSGATLTTLNNNNGKVDEKKIDFHNGPH